MDFEGVEHLIQPEILTPSQWQGMHSSRQLDAEHKLMLAIFLNGIREYQMKPGLKVTEQAQDWVNSRTDNGVFAFEFLCGEFRLDPDFIRAKLKEYSLKGKRIRVVQPPVIEKGQIGQSRRPYADRSGYVRSPEYIARNREQARIRAAKDRERRRAELNAIKEARAAS